MVDCVSSRLGLGDVEGLDLMGDVGGGMSGLGELVIT